MAVGRGVVCGGRGGGVATSGERSCRCNQLMHTQQWVIKGRGKTTGDVPKSPHLTVDPVTGSCLMPRLHAAWQRVHIKLEVTGPPLYAAILVAKHRSPVGAAVALGHRGQLHHDVFESLETGLGDIHDWIALLHDHGATSVHVLGRVIKELVQAGVDVVAHPRPARVRPPEPRQLSGAFARDGGD